jgi:hypothetical protein
MKYGREYYPEERRSTGHMKHVWARFPEEEERRRTDPYSRLDRSKIYICLKCHTLISVFSFWDYDDVRKYGTALCDVECDEVIIEDVMSI